MVKARPIGASYSQSVGCKEKTRRRAKHYQLELEKKERSRARFEFVQEPSCVQAADRGLRSCGFSQEQHRIRCDGFEIPRFRTQTGSVVSVQKTMPSHGRSPRWTHKLLLGVYHELLDVARLQRCC